ncbi:MAG: PQQ-dependent sugar dehydrogenase [Caldimonas sp.]
MKKPARGIHRAIAAALVGAAALALPVATTAAGDVRLETLRVPPGFRIELVTDQVPNARAMTLGRSGVVYIGTANAGKVYAVELEGGRARAVHTVASGLTLPTGVAYRDGSLYVAELRRVLRFDGIDDRLARPPAPAIVVDGLPSETHHGRRFIAFDPEGRLHLSIGSPCNVCLPDERHGVILRMKADGSGVETVARGVRNSVGFDFSPTDGSLWFTDNGRDMLGDDVPADELDHVTTAGQHFGFPFCHQGDVADPEFGAQRACREFTPPAQKLGPHVAALGMRFYTGSQFPQAYRGNIFIAEHGSWNRSRKIGYRVSRVVLDGAGHATRYEPFVEGWLQGQSVWGRPADVLPLPDGSLLISDDSAGALYRVRYAP